MLKRIILILVFLGVLLSVGVAQHKQFGYLNTWNDFDSLHKNNLFFRFENTNFFKNNEYTSPILDGYTLIGVWGRLMFEYYPTDNLRFKIGSHLLKYHGREELEGVNIYPYYLIEYKPARELSVIFGNLNNERNMDLLEPIYNPELFFTQKPPAGLMLDYSHQFIEAKTWIDWHTHIFEGDTFQEEFLYGLSSELFVVNNKQLSFSVPSQFTYHHLGGEIDSSDNQIQTLMNGATGLKFQMRNGKWSYGLSSYYLGYREATSNYLQPFRAGHASLSRFFVGYKESMLSIGYWYGDRYISPKGQRIYQSYSFNNVGEVYPKRELIEGRFLFNIPIKEWINFVIEADAFYDINENSLSYAWGIHLVLSESFFLRKISKPQ